MSRFLFALIFTVTTYGAHAAEAGSTHKTPMGDAARGKEIATTVCAACHGTDGNSLISANPTLAGQSYDYLLKQMTNFKAVDGQPALRANAVMGGMIAATFLAIFFVPMFFKLITDRHLTERRSTAEIKAEIEHAHAVAAKKSLSTPHHVPRGGGSHHE